MISLKELNPSNYPTTEDQAKNLNYLLNRLNKARLLYGSVMTITSGLRTTADQQRINPTAPQSKHLLGLAADIRDTDGALRTWVLEHLDEMSQIGFWFEDFRWTVGWVHFQVVPPKSGNRIFVPNMNPATDNSVWNGVYDHSLDSKLNTLG